MEGVGNLLKNPWVIGGGLGVIALIFIMSRSSTAPTASGYDSATLGAIVQNNQIGAAIATDQANNAAQVAQANIAAQGTMFQSFASLASVVAASNGETTRAALQANAGIFNSIVQTNNAMGADFATNMARSQQVVVNDNSAVMVAKVNGATARAVAGQNAQASIINNSVTALAGVAKAAIAG